MGRGKSSTTKALVARAVELWESVYRPAGIVPTVRQLFYALAVEEHVEKSDKGYGQVQRSLVAAREDGSYPWEGIYDGLRQVRQPAGWGDVGEFFDTVRRSYRLDKWRHQPRRVEVWIEKDAVRGTVESVTDAYEVPLLVARGYLSATAKFEACQRLAERPTTIVYIGDHDPSGVDMWEGAVRWIREVADEGLDLWTDRIAITAADLRDPAIPRLPFNPDDARALAYVQRFGGEVAEVEALPPEVLQARLRYAIESHRDEDLWRRACALEALHTAEIVQRLAG